MKKKRVTVQLLSQEVRVNILPEDKEIFDQSVAAVEKAAQALQTGSKNIPTQQLLAIVSLNMAREVIELTNKNEACKEQLAQEEVISQKIAETISSINKSIEE